MIIWFQTPQIKLYQGNCLDILRQLPSDSIDCVCSSPPYYSLRNYQTQPQAWGGKPDCKHKWGDWQEVRDIREETQHSKSRTTDRHYGDASRRFDGNHQKHVAGSFCNKCGAWLGEFGNEPNLSLYLQHMVEIFAEVRRVLKQSGVVWLNLGDSYASTSGDKWREFNGEGTGLTGSKRVFDAVNRNGAKLSDNFKPKDLMLAPHRAAIALQNDGWWIRQDNVWSKSNAMPSSVKDRTTRSHEYVFQLTKSERYYYDWAAIAEELVTISNVRNKSEEAWTKGALTQPLGAGEREWNRPEGRNKRSVWAINTVPLPSAHFAVMPPELARICILAGCPENGTVLDPFMGSGTVALVAKELNRNTVGIELNPSYCDLIVDRCNQLTIFGELQTTS